jgi:anti-anti-sigma factor
MSLILGIDRRRDGDCVTVLVRGELDLSTTGHLQAELDASMNEPGVEKIVLDLRDLLFCDSGGVATLLTASRLAQLENVQLVTIRPAEPAIATFFDMTGVGAALGIRSADEPAAVEAGGS